jgi:hypothetical protein
LIIHACCSCTKPIVFFSFCLADSHRQKIINWIDSTGGLCAAFDFTTKGILQVSNELLLDEQIFVLSDLFEQLMFKSGSCQRRAVAFARPRRKTTWCDGMVAFKISYVY